VSELDVLRDLARPPRASLEQRLDARERLLRRAERRPSRSIGVLLSSVALAAVTLVGVALVIGGAESATAARALRAAAGAARAQEPLVLPEGAYLYTASVNASLSTHSFGGPAFHVLVPRRREIWLSRDGTGWLRQSAERSVFLSREDRRRWLEYGRPGLDEGTVDLPLRDDVYAQEMATVGLPHDPDRLWALLSERAAGHPRGRAQQLFTLVADALRENYAPPALRGALFDVAARIPGVTLEGDVRDPVGRAGTAVALTEPAKGLERLLIFDEKTGRLLGEREVTLERNIWGYPAGTVVGYAAYTTAAIVEEVKERP
jgi:hypothetical protein